MKCQLCYCFTVEILSLPICLVPSFSVSLHCQCCISVSLETNLSLYWNSPYLYTIIVYKINVSIPGTEIIVFIYRLGPTACKSLFTKVDKQESPKPLLQSHLTILTRNRAHWGMKHLMKSQSPDRWEVDMILVLC